VLLGLLGQVDPVGHLDLRDHQVLVARQAPAVPAVPAVPVVPQELQAPVDHLARPGLLVPVDPQDQVDPLVHKVLRVPQVLQVHQDLRDLRERQEALDRLDLPAPLVLREALDQVVQVGQLEAQGEQGHQVRLGQLEQ